jgi:hypothetical protein
MSLNKNKGDQNSKIPFPGSLTTNSSRSSIPSVRKSSASLRLAENLSRKITALQSTISSLFHQDLRAEQIKVYLKTLNNMRSTMKTFLSNQSKINNDTPKTLPKPKPLKIEEQMPKVYLTKTAKEPSPIEIEKEKMVIKPVHSSAFKIKERGDTENSTNTKKEKELSEKITSECMSLPIKKKLFEGKEEVTIFKNSSKKRDTKTADWRLGLCENIFHTSKNIFLASREEEWKKSRLKENI